jgi:hypothetical protein
MRIAATTKPDTAYALNTPNAALYRNFSEVGRKGIQNPPPF